MVRGERTERERKREREEGTLPISRFRELIKLPFRSGPRRELNRKFFWPGLLIHCPCHTVGNIVFRAHFSFAAGFQSECSAESSAYCTHPRGGDLSTTTCFFSKKKIDEFNDHPQIPRSSVASCAPNQPLSSATFAHVNFIFPIVGSGALLVVFDFPWSTRVLLGLFRANC